MGPRPPLRGGGAQPCSAALARRAYNLPLRFFGFRLSFGCLHRFFEFCRLFRFGLGRR